MSQPRPPRKSRPGAAAKVLGSLAESRRCLTLDELAAELGLARKVITRAVPRLVTNKYVRRADRGCYEATAAGRKINEIGYRPGPQRANTAPPKPSKNSLRQRVWSAMRQRRRFVIADLIELAARPDEVNCYSNIQIYLSRLRAAGYVRELAERAQGTAPESNGFKQFLLIRDTGIIAPVARPGSVRDPNTGEVIQIGGAA